VKLDAQAIPSRAPGHGRHGLTDGPAAPTRRDQIRSVTKGTPGSEADLLADKSERMALGVEPLDLFSELGRQLLARTQPDSAITQVPGNGVPVGAELASQLVCREAAVVELDHLL